MTGFKTKNSTYYVDPFNKRIRGGYFKDKWVKFNHLQAIIGKIGYIQLEDGRIVTTGKIEKYI